jgi:hypothetical protein
MTARQLQHRAAGARETADGRRRGISVTRGELLLCNDLARQTELEERIRAAEREIGYSSLERK